MYGYEKYLTKYPLLVRAMQWTAILNRSEAACAIRDHKRGEVYGGEAVNHFGGNLKVIEQAIKNRHIVRQLAK